MPKILVIGELNVDLILSGLPGLPVLGAEIMAGDLRVVLGSSSAICAAGLARLGAGVDFLGKVGRDNYGDFVVDELGRLGVGTQHVIRDASLRTGVTISLTYPHDRALVTFAGAMRDLRLADVDPSILAGYRHLHAGSYFLQTGLQAGLPELFDLAHRAGLTTSLDTGHDPEERWGGQALLELLDRVDIFLPNEVEARALAGTDGVEEALRFLGRRAGLVVVKRGAAGAAALVEGRVAACPAFPVDVVDTTGAGDSFDAGFLFARVVRQWPADEALRLANACGALSATGYGGTAAQPAFEEATALMRRR
jgi:sugar/nucleoside kinase (ribokinase family)